MNDDVSIPTVVGSEESTDLDSPTRLGLIDRKFTEVINRRA